MEKTSVGLAQLFEPIRADLEKVELEFARHLDSQVRLVPEIGRYLQVAGGKRVRPAVLIMASRMCGYRGELAVLHASVVEFVHTATLVHDDMVDDSSLRRGRETVHARWGNDVSVLFGDYLYIKSMALALTHDSLEIIRVLCDVTLRMIEGELYQLSKNGDVDITEEDHFEIIRRKTAYLFAGCAEIGAILGAASPERQQALRDYGFSLGVTFQLVDDLLDLTGTEAVIGKPIAGDLRDGKMTLPVIHMLQQNRPGMRELVTGVVRDRQLTPERLDAIAAGLADSRSIDYALAQAAGYAERAKRSLLAFPPSSERDALMALPDYVLSRDR